MTKPLWADAGPVRIESPVPGVSITTPYGKKPNNNTYWQARGHHTGADYACRTGTPVVAVLPGTVRTYSDKVLGRIVLLYADNGFTYWYCHLSKQVRTSGRVIPGEVIGLAGMTGTGAAMGPHLHIEKRSGHTTSWAGKDLNPTW